jgi:hypothetical protein
MNIVGEVPRLDAITVESFRKHFYAQQPVLLTRYAASWRALQWSVKALRDRFAGARLPLQMDEEAYDGWCKAMGRAPEKYRRVTFENIAFRVIEMDEYFGAVVQGEARLHLPYVLDVPLARETVMRYIAALGIDTTYDWSALLTALESLAANVDFPPLLEGTRDMRFWFTPRPRSRGVIHADGYHNLNAQIHGCKQWIIQSPDQHSAGEAVTCLTAPGDMLYIPREFWHAAEALDLSINVNAWHVVS